DVVDHTEVGVAPKDLVIDLKISFHVRGSRHGLIGHPDPPLISEDPFILLELVLQQCPLHVPYVVSSQHGRSPAELCSSVRVRRPVHHRHGSVHREVQSNQRLTRTRAGSSEGEFPSSELRVELLKYLARVGDWLSRGTLDPCCLDQAIHLSPSRDDKEPRGVASGPSAVGGLPWRTVRSGG